MFDSEHTQDQSSIVINSVQYLSLVYGPRIKINVRIYFMSLNPISLPSQPQMISAFLAAFWPPQSPYEYLFQQPPGFPNREFQLSSPQALCISGRSAPFSLKVEGLMSELWDFSKMRVDYWHSQNFLVLTFLVLHTKEPNWTNLNQTSSKCSLSCHHQDTRWIPFLSSGSRDKTVARWVVHRRIQHTVKPEKPQLWIIFIFVSSTFGYLHNCIYDLGRVRPGGKKRQIHLPSLFLDSHSGHWVPCLREAPNSEKAMHLSAAPELYSILILLLRVLQR
jgi:hypothetical protein